MADVVDGSAEPCSAAAHDGRPAVALVVKKQSGANTVQVAERVLAALRRGPEAPAPIMLSLSFAVTLVGEAAAEAARSTGT